HRSTPLQAQRTAFSPADQLPGLIPSTQVRREQSRMQAGAEQLYSRHVYVTWRTSGTKHAAVYDSLQRSSAAFGKQGASFRASCGFGLAFSLPSVLKGLPSTSFKNRSNAAKWRCFLAVAEPARFCEATAGVSSNAEAGLSRNNQECDARVNQR